MVAVTIEDCLKIIPNRFELSLIASYRAKQLMNGASTLYIPEKVEKNTVIALREISKNLLDIKKIKEDIKNNLKNQSLFKNFDETNIYDTKKDLETDISLNNNEELEDEELEDEELEDEELEDIELEDEEYYNNISNEDIKDNFDEDLEK